MTQEQSDADQDQSEAGKSAQPIEKESCESAKHHRTPVSTHLREGEGRSRAGRKARNIPLEEDGVNRVSTY